MGVKYKAQIVTLHWGLLLEVQYNTELTAVRYFLKSENQYFPCDP